jgi:hypothetical protein
MQFVGIASDLLDATLKMQTPSRSLSFVFPGTLAAQSGNDHATSPALSSLKPQDLVASAARTKNAELSQTAHESSAVSSN